ncbi:MAG: hypothetical protein ACO1N9_10825 [Flavobacterium sp.]
MKKISEMIVRKDSSIHKVQFDKEWFYSLEDMEDFLKEDLSAVEAISLPMMVYGEEMVVKCATWEDIERARTQPLDDFRGSVPRNQTKKK